MWSRLALRLLATAIAFAALQGWAAEPLGIGMHTMPGARVIEGTAASAHPPAIGDSATNNSGETSSPVDAGRRYSGPILDDPPDDNWDKYHDVQLARPAVRALALLAIGATSLLVLIVVSLLYGQRMPTDFRYWRRDHVWRQLEYAREHEPDTLLRASCPAQYDKDTLLRAAGAGTVEMFRLLRSSNTDMRG